MVIPLLLHGRHAECPVTYQPFGPWIVPWQFQSLEAEYQTLRTGVGLIDFSHQSLLEVRGEDRIGFLHNLLTNDMQRLTPGTGCHAALLTPNAKCIAELLVLADRASVWLMCDVTLATTVTQALDRYLFTEQVTVRNLDRTMAVLALQGPRTFALLHQILGAPLALPHVGDHVIASLHGFEVRLIHHTLTEGPGVLCVVSAAHTHGLWNALQRSDDGSGVPPIGWGALNVARIEAGIPWFGIDLDESNLLSETGLESRVVSGTKGCYVGQEIVARMQTYGSASQKLVGLQVAGGHVPRPGDRVVRGDGEVGRVTSACWSLALDAPIAMGYVKRGAYEPGTTVEIIQEGRRLTATIRQQPIVRQRGENHASCQ